MIMGEAARLLVIGLVIGTALSLIVGRTTGSLRGAPALVRSRFASMSTALSTANGRTTFSSIQL